MTRTPLYAHWIAAQDDPAATERSVAAAIPLGRIAEPADVAAAVGFLASADAAYITNEEGPPMPSAPSNADRQIDGCGLSCRRPPGAWVSGLRHLSINERTLQAMELVLAACCGKEWVGADRAHCCARASCVGCGEVFDDAELFDAHRLAGECADPRRIGLVQTKNGIWLRALDLSPAS